MQHKKLSLVLLLLLLFCQLFAQNDKINEHSFYQDRILKAPESVFKKFIDAGMSPVNHQLSQEEKSKVDKAFSLLPPLHKKILQEHLHSISFMDNMPNTALTSPIEPEDTPKMFNITFRAGILNETISEWATWKEKSLYDTSANPSLKVQIDAGELNAFVYVLLHEATHVVDAILALTPHVEEIEAAMVPTSFTKNIWRLFNTPESQFINPRLEKTRFRSGKIQPISSAIEIYTALNKTPFSSLYAMASCYEDVAEFITIYHLTQKLNQPFVVYLREEGKINFRFEPMKNKLVKRRGKKIALIYAS